MKAFFESQFNYCPLVWMFHNRTMNNRINRIHERSLRIVYNDYVSSFEQLLNKSDSFTIHERNLQRLATEIYKSKNNLSPSFMKGIFIESLNPRHLRIMPTHKTLNVKSVYNGTETISHRGPQVWLLVPESIRNATTLKEFKRKVKNGNLGGACAGYTKHM